MSTPAGWYPDTTMPGTQRYWDGNGWTEHVAPLAPPAPPPATTARPILAEPLTATGTNGQVSFDGGMVTLHRQGMRARATVGKGEKRIPVRSISAVQWKPAGGMVNGFIQFTVAGGNEARSRMGRQTMDAVHDENSVVFTKKQMPAFEAIRNAVDQALAQY